MGNFEEAFILRNPNYGFLMERLRKAIETEEVNYSDITSANLRKFKEYMSESVSANSLKTYTAVLKAFITECCNDGLISNAKCVSALKTKATPQQNIALNEDDMKKIEEYYDNLQETPGHQVEKDILTLFLIESVCGARGVDVEQITTDNIQNGKLTYVSQKTKVLAVIPAHRRLEMLLLRKPMKHYFRSTKNRIIKEVCRKCGLTEPVTLFYHGKMVTMSRYELCGMHTARRTFASILASKGVPIAEISQYMSHTSQTMTQRYIKVDSNRVSDAAMAFFGT